MVVHDLLWLKKRNQIANVTIDQFSKCGLTLSFYDAPTQ